MPFLLRYKQSKFEIVWCSTHGQAAVKHEFCNSLQQFFDLLYIILYPLLLTSSVIFSGLWIGALSMTKLQPFKLCLSRTFMTCIRNAMNSFYFVPALVTFSPTFMTPREQIAPSMETDDPLVVATTTFASSPFFDLP